MLPSQGLFRSIPCPFFLAGLCERPHCTYRHCKSDIRIDRKQESEILNDVPIGEESEGNSKSSAGTLTQDKPNGSANQIESLKTDKASDILKAPDPGGTNVLINPQNREVKRKRSIDSSEDKSSSKKPRIEDSEASEDMGQLLSSVVKGVISVCKTVVGAEDKKASDELPDIDQLVREIEAAGKPSESSKKSSSHKHKKGRKKDSHSEKSSHKDKHKDRHISSSHRKENRSKHEETNNKSEVKEKDKRHHSGYDKKSSRKESSSSNSSSSRERSHHRSSSSKDKTTSSHKEKNGDVPPTASSPKKERRISGSSSGKGSSDSFKTSPGKASISVSNRFKALAEGSADEESAYNSDTFDDNSMELELSYSMCGGSESEDDMEAIQRECMEMFENYVPPTSDASSDQLKGSRSNDEQGKKEAGDDGFNVVGKKRVAHINAVGKPTASPLLTSPVKKPVQVTSKGLQDQIVKRFENQSKFKAKSPTHNGTSLFATPAPRPQGKMRIAHVPNAKKLAQKPVIASAQTDGVTSTTNSGQRGSLTYSQTAAKGVSRQAHKPTTDAASKPAPLIIRDAINKSSKIPHVTRQTIMEKLYVEYLRIFDDYKRAFETAVSKENDLLGKCSSKHVYYSSGISMISGLRKLKKEDSVSGPNRVVSHQQILNGSLDLKNCSVLSGRKDYTLPEGNALYKALLRYLMTQKDLEENGYPRPTSEKGMVTAKPRQSDDASTSFTNRVCDRCRRRYRTNDDGEQLISEVCNYHAGKKFNMMSKIGRGMREATYNCCGSDDDRLGCMTAPYHVSKSPIPISSQKGFVSAVLDAGEIDIMGLRAWDVVGIDCEMVYTTHGNELARVTVVGANLKVLYDAIVKPTHKVIDCNTRFSGLVMEDIEKSTHSITEIQAVLLASLRKNSIIIGHSLESDLIALKLCHDTVIDTTILYPHRMGPPKKRALKNLSGEILQKVIQESEGGHDSAEDAQIALELVLAKLKSDMGSSK